MNTMYNIIINFYNKKKNKEKIDTNLKHHIE